MLTLARPAAGMTRRHHQANMRALCLLLVAVLLATPLQGCAVAVGAGLGVLVTQQTCTHPATAAQHKWLCGQ